MPEQAARPDPSLGLLLLPKWLTARTRAMANERGRGARFTMLAVIGLGFWAFIYTLLYKLLVYFRSVPDLGPFLAGKLLGLILIGFFSLLLLSNVITALSSFFLARDLDLRSCWRRG
jgi:ABC-2 type transport system permease protein